MGGALGAVVKFGGDFLGLFSGHLETARAFGSRIFYYGADISPMLVAVGLIVRLNVALLIFIGGVLSWVIALPMLDATGVLLENNAIDSAWELWSTKIRYVGVGAMVLGGVVSILQVRKGLVEAIRILRARLKGTHDDTSEDRDLPTGVMLLVGTVSITIIGALYWNFTQSGANHRGDHGVDDCAVLLHDRCGQLYRRLGGKLEQSRVGHDDHRGPGPQARS